MDVVRAGQACGAEEGSISDVRSKYTPSKNIGEANRIHLRNPLRTLCFALPTGLWFDTAHG